MLYDLKNPNLTFCVMKLVINSLLKRHGLNRNMIFVNCIFFYYDKYKNTIRSYCLKQECRQS